MRNGKRMVTVGIQTADQYRYGPANAPPPPATSAPPRQPVVSIDYQHRHLGQGHHYYDGPTMEQTTTTTTFPNGYHGNNNDDDDAGGKRRDSDEGDSLLVDESLSPSGLSHAVVMCVCMCGVYGVCVCVYVCV